MVRKTEQSCIYEENCKYGRKCRFVHIKELHETIINAEVTIRTVSTEDLLKFNASKYVKKTSIEEIQSSKEYDHSKEHGNEKRSNNEIYKFFLEGNCWFGEKCSFKRHEQQQQYQL